MGHADPGLDRNRFYCVTCREVTDQEHFDLRASNTKLAISLPDEWAVTCCTVCRLVTIFYEGEQVIPPRLHGQFDFDSLPRGIADEVRCALKTVHSSPRASAAHARTALYAMLVDLVAPDEETHLPADQLFAQVVPETQTVMHAYFRDTCLRSGTFVPAGVQQHHEPHGTASALLDLLRLVRSLYPRRD
jgi:hypothetical protein